MQSYITVIIMTYNVTSGLCVPLRSLQDRKVGESRIWRQRSSPEPIILATNFEICHATRVTVFSSTSRDIAALVGSLSVHHVRTKACEFREVIPTFDAHFLDTAIEAHSFLGGGGGVGVDGGSGGGLP